MVLRDGPAISWYWLRRLTRLYVGFLPPPVKAYLEPVASACGQTPLRNASYCPADNTIYYDLAFLAELTKRYGPQTAEIVLAHEYGHAVQAHLGLLGVDWLLRSQIELQADCFAGVYVAAAAVSRGRRTQTRRWLSGRRSAIRRNSSGSSRAPTGRSSSGGKRS